jgi:nucleoside-diphosphate-sugar epimerase
LLNHKKTVLILGANGFLGRECCKIFAQNGYSVSSADRSGKVDYLVDFSSPIDVDSLPCNLDIVVNCAAVQYVSKELPFFFRQDYFYRNNVEAARNLYLRFRHSNCHFIHVGTSMMYKQTVEGIYSTKSKIIQQGLYSHSKISAQRYFDKLPRMATVIPCIIGGIGRGGLFEGFINSISKFGGVIIPGKGRNLISMVHVSDVANLIFLLAEKRSQGYFNAAGRHALTISDWIEIIGKHLEKSPWVIRLPIMPIKLVSLIVGYRFLAKEQLLMLEYPHLLDISESLNLGWKPRFNNYEIIKEIADYIIEKSKTCA